jgi:N-acetylmuramoyl-L-alanine amidase
MNNQGFTKMEWLFIISVIVMSTVILPVGVQVYASSNQKSRQIASCSSEYSQIAGYYIESIQNNIAIVLPMFARAREKARQCTCTSNLRQISAEIEIYNIRNNATSRL